mgnify:CR=1 FL=1
MKLACTRSTLSMLDKAKADGRAAWSYAKQNPGDILLGIITLLVVDASESLEQIETYESVQAYTDLQSFYTP